MDVQKAAAQKESIKLAIEKCQLAIQLEKANNLQSALSMYCESITLMISATKCILSFITPAQMGQMRSLR